MIISKTQKISSASKMLPHLFQSVINSPVHKGPEEISSKGDLCKGWRQNALLRGEKMHFRGEPKLNMRLQQ